MDSLEISTIDILKAVVDEFNIHGMIPEGSLLNIPKAHYRFDVIEFCDLAEDRVEELHNFIKSRLAKNETIVDWLKKKSSEPLPDNPDSDEDEDDDNDEIPTNEQLVRSTFGIYLWRTKMSSIYPSLFKDQYTRFGTVKEDPDERGFFVIQDDGEDELWCAS